MTTQTTLETITFDDGKTVTLARLESGNLYGLESVGIKCTRCWFETEAQRESAYAVWARWARPAQPILAQLATNAVAQDSGQRIDTGFCPVGCQWLAQVICELETAGFRKTAGRSTTIYSLAGNGTIRTFAFDNTAAYGVPSTRWTYTETPCADHSDPAPSPLTTEKNVTPAVVLCEVCEEVAPECVCAKPKPKAETMSVKRYMGSTDERTTCDLCGKTNLKRTFCFDVEGVLMFVGSDCAKINFGIVKVEHLQEQLVDVRETARREFFDAHPLMVAVETERDAYQAGNGGFLTGALQSGHIARWNEMYATAKAEWEAHEKTLTFSVECPELRIPEAIQQPKPTKPAHVTDINDAPAETFTVAPSPTAVPRTNTVDTLYHWKPRKASKKATAQPLFEARLF